MRSPVAYLLAVLGVLAIGCGSVVALEVARPGGEWNSQATYTIIGACTTVLTVLLGIVKSIANGSALEEVKDNAAAAATEAATAKTVAAVTRQELKANTAATLETKQAVARALAPAEPRANQPRGGVQGGG